MEGLQSTTQPAGGVIAVISSDPATSSAAVRQLQGAGHRTAVFTAVDEAVYAHATSQFSAALLDLSHQLPLPPLSAFRRLYATCRSPIVVVPPENDADVADRLLRDGAADLVTPDELQSGRLPVVFHRARQRFMHVQRLRQRLEEEPGIIDSLPAEIALLDADGTILLTNERWRKFGAANGLPEQAGGVGDNYLDVCDRSDNAHEAAAVAAGIRAVLARKLPSFSLEYPCHSPTEQRWFRMSATPFESARVFGAVVAHVDITERQLALDLSRQVNDRLEKILESSLDVICTFDAEGRFQQVNSACRGVWGYTQEELLGRDYMELIVPEDRERTAGAAEEVRRGKLQRHFQNRYRTKDGSVRHIMWSARWSDESQSMYCVARDVTEAIEAAQRIAQSEAEYRALFEANPEPAWVYDVRTLRFLAVNDAAVAKYGYSREEFLGMTVHRIRPEDSGEPLARAHELRFGYVANGILRHVTKQGEVLLVEVYSHNLTFRGAEAQMVLAHDVTARVRAEERTHQLATRLESTLESLTDAFMTLDREWRFTYVNRQSEVVLRQSRHDLLGKVIWDVFPDARDSVFHREYARALSEQKTVAFEAYYAGLNRWFDVKAYPSTEGLSIYFRDITASHHAKQEAFINAERFRLLAMATNDAVWDWDLEKGTIWWNEGFEILFGFRRSEMPPGYESWSNLVHPEDFPAVRENLEAVLQGGSSAFTAEYRFRKKDGSYATVFDRGYALRNERGEPVRMVGGITDVTDRMKAAAQIEQQASLIDEAHDAIIVRDSEHRITFWSKGAERVFGWKRIEAVGRVSFELLHPNLEDFQAADRIVKEKGSWSGELRKRTRSGNLVVVECSWTLVRRGHSDELSILQIETDITERKRLHEQFLRAQRLESLGTLAGGIAHDLNNLLAPIVLGVELLKLRGSDQGDRHIVAGIEQSARRGAELVKQILTFTRGSETTRLEIDPKHVVREVQAIAESSFPKSIAIITEVPAKTAAVVADVTQLTQVLLNLCVNARDAMPQGGTLTITLVDHRISNDDMERHPEGVPGDYVRIDVADTGTGMTEEVQQKMFDPFFTTKPLGKGTGLGLSTVMGIVKNHSGFLDVRSTLGAGSTFSIFLPAATGTAPVQIARPGHAQTRQGRTGARRRRRAADPRVVARHPPGARLQVSDRGERSGRAQRVPQSSR
jgi:PAS domain S-box-containing protein